MHQLHQHHGSAKRTISIGGAAGADTDSRDRGDGHKRCVPDPMRRQDRLSDVAPPPPRRPTAGPSVMNTCTSVMNGDDLTVRR